MGMFALVQVSGILTTLSELHIGEGTSCAMTSDICSPVRKAGGKPIIPATTLKGVLKDIATKTEVNADCIDRLFGTSSRRGQLLFEDLKVKVEDNKALYGTKYENALDRCTGTATLRVIETVTNNDFGISIKYQVISKDTVEEDMKTLIHILDMLKYEGIGANKSRGYGKVKCHDCTVEVLVGDLDGELDEILEAVNTYSAEEMKGL